MKKQVVLFGSLFITVALLMGVASCKKKVIQPHSPYRRWLHNWNGGNIDLNAATSANTVPSNPTIVATFSLAVNAASVDLRQHYPVKGLGSKKHPVNSNDLPVPPSPSNPMRNWGMEPCSHLPFQLSPQLTASQSPALSAHLQPLEPLFQPVRSHTGISKTTLTTRWVLLTLIV